MVLEEIEVFFVNSYSAFDGEFPLYSTPISLSPQATVSIVDSDSKFDDCGIIIVLTYMYRYIHVLHITSV